MNVSLNDQFIDKRAEIIKLLNIKLGPVLETFIAFSFQKTFGSL